MAEHLLFLDEDITTGFWGVECSCGWEDRQQYTHEAAAEDAWENHCDVVFMEATGG